MPEFSKLIFKLWDKRKGPPHFYFDGNLSVLLKNIEYTTFPFAGEEERGRWVGAFFF
jgi:hypothetical protein